MAAHLAKAPIETKLFLVSGHVQGVGFRRFVEKQGLTLGLVGWVRNLSDGRVEAVAQGSAEAMKHFLAQLYKGPPNSQVDQVEVKETDEKTHFSSAHFIIR